jgi:uncharacterized membrane protein
MLKFVNGTNQELWVAYMFHAPGECGGEGGDFLAIGWFHMPPFGSTVPYANNLNDVHNRYWHYYAENANRSQLWAGPYSVYVPDDGRAFNHCYKIATSTSRIIGMRLFDVGDSNNFTMTLSPHLDIHTGLHPI